MKRTELLRLLNQALELEPATMREETELAALANWDSMSPMVIMALADKEFHLKLAAKDIQRCKTGSDLIGLFGDRVHD